MGFLAVISILLLNYQYTERERDYSQQDLSKQAEIVLKTTAIAMRDELYSLKIDELRDLANKIDENDEITLFIVYDKNGKMLVDSRTSGWIFTQTVDVLGKDLVSLSVNETYYEWLPSQLIAGQSVRIGSKVIGAIAIGFSTKPLERKINDITSQGFILATIFIFIGAMFTFGMARRLTAPLSDLANVASEMEKGNLNVRANPSKTHDEIGQLSIAFNQMADAIQEREKALRDQADGLEKTVNERTSEIKEQARILEEMAITDPLTHAYNRRQFYKIAEIEMKLARKNNHPLSVIVIDADHFKLINDTYGHHAGDLALIKLAETCQNAIRDTDVFARYGGEEFVVLMPNTDALAANQIAERIRKRVEEESVESEEKIVRFTISLGVSTFQTSKQPTFDSLLTQADKALYNSKKSGRNRVTHWEEETP